MADVRLDGFLGQEQVLADLAIHEPVRDELKHLDLAGGRILADLTRRRRREGDNRTAPSRATPCRSSLEPAAVVSIAIEDLPTLGSVHESRIGGGEPRL